MIIFYEPETGIVRGTIDGRMHNDKEIAMEQVSDGKQMAKIVVQWIPKFAYIDMKTEELLGTDYEPDHFQKELFIELDKKPVDIYNYKVDLSTKLLVKKEA